MRLTIGVDVPVSENDVRAFPAFKRWLRRMHPKWILEELHVFGAELWGPVVARIYVKATVVDHHGRRLESQFCMSGRVVDVTAIVAVEGQQYLLVVEQSRVAAGGSVISNVSGFVEPGESDLEAVLRELRQELGVEINWGWVKPANELVVNSKEAWLVNPGATTEEVVFFVAYAVITPEQLLALRHRRAGEKTEGESTIVHPVPIEELLDFLARFAGGRADLKTVQGISIAKQLALI